MTKKVEQKVTIIIYGANLIMDKNLAKRLIFFGRLIIILSIVSLGVT